VRRLALTPPDPPLGDDRVLLRAWRAEDLGDVKEAVRDPVIARFNRLGEGFDVEAWFERMPAERADGRALRLRISDPVDDTLLGAVSLHALELTLGRAMLGYWLAPEARGRGVATSAVRLITGWGRSELGLRRFEAITLAANGPSRRLLERCGFVASGELLDDGEPAVRYALAGPPS
jgi:RimJ/RimL family protein N-acetyltransferase